MKDPKLEILKAEVKNLNARVGALESLLERIIRQRPVSEKQLDKVVKSLSRELRARDKESTLQPQASRHPHPSNPTRRDNVVESGFSDISV